MDETPKKTKPVPKNVHQRLAEAIRSVGKLNPTRPAGMKYDINSHDNVTTQTRAHLLDAGIVYYPVGIETKVEGQLLMVTLHVSFVNVDDPEDHFEVPSLGFAMANDSTGSGKALSYAVKYAVMKTLMMSTGEDTDFDAAQTAQEPRSAPVPPTAAPVAPPAGPSLKNGPLKVESLYVGDDGHQVAVSANGAHYANLTDHELEAGNTYVVGINLDTKTIESVIM